MVVNLVCLECGGKLSVRKSEDNMKYKIQCENPVCTFHVVADFDGIFRKAVKP